MTGEPHGFSRVAVGFSSYDGELREPLLLPQGSPISIRVARGNWGFLSSETGMSGIFLSCIKGVNYRFEFQEETWDFSRDAAVGKGLILQRQGTSWFFSSCGGKFEL